jgi:hypothetical protein
MLLLFEFFILCTQNIHSIFKPGVYKLPRNRWAAKFVLLHLVEQTIINYECKRGEKKSIYD